MDRCVHMKRSNLIAVGIAVVLFIIPFFWLKPGFVDLGGDSGRLYFLDPLGSALNVYGRQNFAWAPFYSIIPYELFLYVLKTLVGSATNLISVTRGLHLSLAFLSVFFIIRRFLFSTKELQNNISDWVAIVTGVLYVGFLSSTGWVASLETHYQGFLNPLMFYLLLQYSLSTSFLYGILFVTVSLLYSGNFGFSAMPQLMAFFPLAILFLLSSLRFVISVPIPWKKLILLLILFVGLHFFHLLPTAATILHSDSTRHTQIFSSESISELGVHYFDANHKTLGKMSTQLFQFLFVPIVILLAFVTKPSKTLAMIGGFFAVSLFLVSANITQLGVAFYRLLFYIPGFFMFRSFNDKWYYVFIFFYTFLFGVSLHELLRKKKNKTVVIISLTFIAIMVYRMLPFLQGKAIFSPLYQSNNVSAVFTVDPDLLDTLSYIRALPDEGKFLTLPLTFPYFQIAYGKEGGAYVGVSTLLHVSNRSDYPGFWSMGTYGQPVFDAIHGEDWEKLLSLLHQMNVRYVFHNSDNRIMDNFPGYPYVYPGMMYSSKEQLPAIRDQVAYQKFLSSLPLHKIYEKGFYSVYEVMYANPPVYTPNFEIPPKEQQYFFVGRMVSIATLVAIVILCFL